MFLVMRDFHTVYRVSVLLCFRETTWLRWASANFPVLVQVLIRWFFQNQFIRLYIAFILIAISKNSISLSHSPHRRTVLNRTFLLRTVSPRTIPSYLPMYECQGLGFQYLSILISEKSQVGWIILEWIRESRKEDRSFLDRLATSCREATWFKFTIDSLY